MEEVLGRRESRLKKMVLSKNKSQQDRDIYRRKREKFEQDLTVAIEKDKDEVALMLIKKSKPLIVLQDELERHIHSMDQEINGFKETLEHQRIRYGQLKHRANEYFHSAEMKKWENTLPSFTQWDTTIDMTDEEIELELLQRKEALNMSCS